MVNWRANKAERCRPKKTKSHSPFGWPMGLRNPPLVVKIPYNKIGLRGRQGKGGQQDHGAIPTAALRPLGSCGPIERTPNLPQPLLELIQLLPETGRQPVPECLEMLLDVRHLGLPLGGINLQECT